MTEFEKCRDFLKTMPKEEFRQKIVVDIMQKSSFHRLISRGDIGENMNIFSNKMEKIYPNFSDLTPTEKINIVQVIISRTMKFI